MSVGQVHVALSQRWVKTIALKVRQVALMVRGC